MNKKRIVYNYYKLAVKIGGRLSSWNKLIGENVRMTKDRMNVVYIPVEKKVEAPASKFVPLDIVDALIDRAKGTAIFGECLCRVGGRCEEYPHDIACLAMGEVEDLDPKHGDIVSKDEAKAHVRKALDAGLYPLISHYERDAMIVSLDFDHLLIVCLCCPCHCVARNAGRESIGLDNSFDSNSGKFPTVEILFDESKCNGCEKCVKECIAGAITFEDNKIHLDSETCKGCGHCTQICDAFSVTYDIKNVDKILEELNFTQFIT